MCFEATPTYACTAQSPTYTETGTYEWSTSFSDFWSPPGESVDWTQGVNKIACILKDTMNNKPSADNVGPETAALYMPTEVRMVVTIVEPGGVYEPPIPSGQGGSGGTGGSGGQGGSGGAGGSGGEGGSGNGTGGAGGTDTGSGGSGASGSNNSEGGCSLVPRSDGVAMGWIALSALALWAERRRRRASRTPPF